MVITYLTVGLVHWLFDQLAIWNHYELKRPIVIGPIMGLIMGDIITGCLIGAALELMYLGFINVGGIQASDPAYATTLACAFVILYGYDISTAAVLTVPFGYIGLYLHKFPIFVNSFFIPLWNKLIREDKMKSYKVLYPTIPTIANSINGLSLFIGLMIGESFFTNLYESLPAWLLTGWGAAASMLPAIGLGMLLYFLWDKRKLVYFLLGFALVAYLGAPTLLIAFIGVTFAVVDFFRNKDLSDKLKEIAGANLAADKGGLF